MMAKIVKGRGFKGVVNYILDKAKGTEILDTNEVRLKSADTIIDSFIFQSELNSQLTKPVGHISLDFSAQDREKLTNEFMVQIAKDYMNRMGISETQYLIARHYDKEHPHIHLVFNRIDYNGETISDRNDRPRSAKICKELTRKYSLYFAPGKEKVKESRLKEPDKTRYEIYHKLKEIVPHSQSWEQVIRALKDQNVWGYFQIQRENG
ncbi:MAG: relaxase/mobilization nuclease domain-containing protein [Prolixibacteraceae bacterium]|nr:relaxase/mobilization nuclease domain-containing protein [Prolixibacteraceae bacterium]